MTVVSSKGFLQNPDYCHIMSSCLLAWQRTLGFGAFFHKYAYNIPVFVLLQYKLAENVYKLYLLYNSMQNYYTKYNCFNKLQQKIITHYKRNLCIKRTINTVAVSIGCMHLDYFNIPF